MNEEDAAAMGVRDGDMVTVSSRRGKINTMAVVGDKSARRDVMTFHFRTATPTKSPISWWTISAPYRIQGLRDKIQRA
jgi:anaerobic selenocysteine-containing dehydrogenase